METAHDTLDSAVPKHASPYADHQDHRAEIANPEGEGAGLTHVPDVIVKSGASNSMLIEVETKDSLENNPDDALSQLADFSKRGYRRVLVVPKAHEDAGQAFVDKHGHRLDGKYYLAVPSTVTELL